MADAVSLLLLVVGGTAPCVAHSIVKDHRKRAARQVSRSWDAESERSIQKATEAIVALWEQKKRSKGG